MHKWRPAPSILVKVIGICIDRERLLAMDVYNDRGEVKGVRPLGGHVEFGETREAALRREFHEELDTEIDIGEEWFAFENLYSHHRRRGHEFLFAAEVRLHEISLLEREIIVFSEDSGTENVARWYDLQALHAGSVALFPPALLELL